MKERIKLSILWIFSFIVIIFMMAFTSNAAGDGILPYNKSQIMTYNSFMSNDILDKFRDSNLPIDNDNYVLIYSDHSPYTQYPQYNNQYDVIYYYFLLPIEDFESISEGFNFYNNSINVNLTSNSSYYYISVTCDYSSNFELIAVRTPSYASYSTSLYQSGLFGHIPSIDNTSGFSFTPMSPVFFNKDFFSSNDVLVLDDNLIPNPIDIGAAIIPPDAITPVYPSGTTPPSQVPPTFTASDYNWTTPPTFDSSSIENAIGSIQNTLGWIANNLKEEFKNLTNNLKGFFKYIGDTIQYYGNAIISTLNNFIKNFYDNMKSLVEPIFQKIDYITTPLEADIIWDNISGTSLITNYSSIINAASSMKSSFENLSEPTDYKIPIHLEDLPSSWFGNLTTQYIDLGVINPVKNILRTFMWALITYSLFLTIIDSIANYINGGGDES